MFRYFSSFLFAVIFGSVLTYASPMLYQEGSIIAGIETNKARYAPGDTVMFSVTLTLPSAGNSFLVKYFHEQESIGQQSLSIESAASASWSWLPPGKDYQGYLVQILALNGQDTLDLATIGVDVSSQYGKFIRYGFLSSYWLIFPSEIDNVIKKLNRYHINGIQFYDWHYKHHMPLKGTPENPASQWKDIANRDNYFVTIKGYIDAAHARNMKTMAYNLLYGAYSDAANDSVKVDDWGLFKDASHSQRYMFDLPSGWASDLYFMDPSNMNWKGYLFAQEKKVFQALPFDGWHIDQVGDPGDVYSYTGTKIRIADHFQSFIEQAKGYLNVPLAFNAVNQYGQQGIAQAPVDFLYTEVWDVAKTYGGLKQLTEQNWSYNTKRLNTVFAAYMNYGLSGKAGTIFNTPGVLLTDAVMFASGASHLELGEHMLIHEYFPNSNGQMSAELQRKLVNYYDFLTAYENLLRDSATASLVSVISNSSTVFSKSEALGSVWYFARAKNNRQIIHFINFTSAAHLQWRDDNGTQTTPPLLTNLPISIVTTKKVKSIWLSTPDSMQGTPVSIPFSQEAGTISCTLPSLHYWDMLVVEYEDPTPVKESKNETGKNEIKFPNIYPNPFNPSTTITYSLPFEANVNLAAYNSTGERIATIVNRMEEAGEKKIVWSPAVSSGIYFLCINVTPIDGMNKPFNQTNKLIYMK